MAPWILTEFHFQPIQSPDNLLHELFWSGRVGWDGKSSTDPNSAAGSGFFVSKRILGNGQVVKKLVAVKRSLFGVAGNGQIFRLPYDGSSEVSLNCRRISSFCSSLRRATPQCGLLSSAVSMSDFGKSNLRFYFFIGTLVIRSFQLDLLGKSFVYCEQFAALHVLSNKSVTYLKVKDALST